MMQARLEVLSMVVNLLFLAALNFSLLVEAVQTMVQYGDKDAMHEPATVGILTVVGIAINLLCIALIGGNALLGLGGSNHSKK